MTSTKLEQLRTERNTRLQASDYWMLPDFTGKEEEVEAIKIYRQALRDLPANYDGKKAIKWPEPPTTTQDT